MAYPSDLTRTKNWGTEVLTDSDLEGQYDLIINWAMAAFNASTGHAHDGTSNNGPKLSALASLTFGGSQATGDMIYASSASAISRLAIGSATTVLHGGTTPAFSALVTADLPAGTVLQYVTAKSGAVASGTGTYTLDDNIPTTSNGNALAALNLTITPKNASNILEFSGVMNLANNTTGVKQMVVALHQDSTANAVAVFTHTKGSDDDQIVSVPISFTVAAGTTSATTFKLYYGGDGASTTTVNGTAAARKWGGVLYSSFTVKELKA